MGEAWDEAASTRTASPAGREDSFRCETGRVLLGLTVINQDGYFFREELQRQAQEDVLLGYLGQSADKHAADVMRNAEALDICRQGESMISLYFQEFADGATVDVVDIALVP